MKPRLFAVGSLALLAGAIASACAPAPPIGGHVDIADESAIIIWDAAAKTEHFIRRAQFMATVKEFGFLVPTPSRPALADAPDSSFDHLATVTAPRVVTKVRYEPAPGIRCGASSSRDGASVTASVQVLEL